MKFNIDININNKTLFYRYIPSVIIILLVVVMLFWSLFISKFGNNCVSSDASFLLSAELKQDTNNLTANILNLIKNKQYKSIASILDDSLGDYKTISRNLEPIRNMLPDQPIQNLTIAGVTREVIYDSNGQRVDKIYTLTEVNYPYSDFVVEMQQLRMNDKIKINGFRVSGKQALLRLSKATWQNVTAGGYFTILCMLLVLSIVLYALILCINTDIERRKWLWILFILFGFFGVNFNWLTQSYSFNLINISLLGVGWYKANCFDPLILSFSIPVGALIFLYKQYMPSLRKINKN